MPDGIPPATPSRTPVRSLVQKRLLTTFSIYILLGLPEGVLGTVWPSAQQTFQQPASGLASVLIAYTLGYLVATFGSGWLTELFETERATQLGVAVTLAGLLGYTLAPAWVLFVLSALLIGCGAGTVDAVINADVALRHGQRVMHLLHASFGVGATLGPLLVGLLLEVGADWRVAYGLLAVLEGAVLLRLLTLSDQRNVDEAGGRVNPTKPSAARPDVALAATLVQFAVYVGVEVSIGAWTFSVLVGERDYGVALAGVAVAGYWAGLTVGRLVLSALDDALSELSLLRGASAVAIVASIWFWLDGPASVLALPLLGFAFAGIFPSLVLLTPGWLGTRRVARAVGYQLAASSAGAIVAAWSIGRLVGSQGLGAAPAAFVVLCLLLAASQAFTEWATRP